MKDLPPIIENHRVRKDADGDFEFHVIAYGWVSDQTQRMQHPLTRDDFQSNQFRFWTERALGTVYEPHMEAKRVAELWRTFSWE